jgi:hypothetical protein
VHDRLDKPEPAVAWADEIVTDAQGRPWHADSTSFLAAPGGLHAQFVELLAQAESAAASA